MSGKIWLNGRLVSEKQAKVSVLDRGFLYGDGVYETVRVYGGKIFRAENHWRRLDRSLKGLRMKAPWTHSQLTRACEAVIRANRLQESPLRMCDDRTAMVGFPQVRGSYPISPTPRLIVTRTRHSRMCSNSRRSASCWLRSARSLLAFLCKRRMPELSLRP
jgi:branched-subunit amino acid aminotransferase/4-amino-4-deoxychorismate lyase